MSNLSRSSYTMRLSGTANRTVSFTPRLEEEVKWSGWMEKIGGRNGFRYQTRFLLLTETQLQYWKHSNSGTSYHLDASDTTCVCSCLVRARAFRSPVPMCCPTCVHVGCCLFGDGGDWT